jgi:hypothetical protein
LEREIKNAFDDVNARMVEIFFSKNEAHAIVLVLKDGRVLNMTKTRNRFLRLLYYVFIWDDHIIYIYIIERDMLNKCQRYFILQLHLVRVT